MQEQTSQNWEVGSEGSVIVPKCLSFPNRKLIGFHLLS